MKIWTCLLVFLGSTTFLPAQEPDAVSPDDAPKAVPAPDGVKITVLGDRVNLRNKPSLESEIITQASYGDVFTALSFTDMWIEISPPDTVSTWAFSPLLFEDKEVRIPEMNLRSGPGTQFARLGQIVRGTEVIVLESLGEWRRIMTPKEVTLWISRDFVQLPPSIEQPARPEPTPTATPVPIPTPITIVEVRTVEKIVEVPVPAPSTPPPEVQAPVGLDLVPLRGQGTSSSRRGEVKAFLLKAGSPSRFILRRPDGTTLCYLLGNEEQLRSVAGKTVIVRGRDFWVTGEDLPVTEVQQLNVMPEVTP